MDIKYKIKLIGSQMVYGRRKQLLDDISFLIAASELHKNTFGPYKNYCEGKRDIVVCAAGPSFSKYEPIEGAVHIGVNRAFLNDKVKFDFILAQDYDGIFMCYDELKDYRRGECVKFLGRNFRNEKKNISESYILACDAREFWLSGSLSYGKAKFVNTMECDIDKKPFSGMMNVGQSVIQLALFMNPRKLYIVGCDVSGGHFSGANLSEKEQAREKAKLERFWAKTRIQQIDRWKAIKHFAEVNYPDTEIISVNPVGLKGIFEDLYQSEECK